MSRRPRGGGQLRAPFDQDRSPPHRGSTTSRRQGRSARRTPGTRSSGTSSAYADGEGEPPRSPTSASRQPLPRYRHHRGCDRRAPSGARPTRPPRPPGRSSPRRSGRRTPRSVRGMTRDRIPDVIEHPEPERVVAGCTATRSAAAARADGARLAVERHEAAAQAGAARRRPSSARRPKSKPMHDRDERPRNSGPLDRAVASATPPAAAAAQTQPGRGPAGGAAAGTPPPSTSRPRSPGRSGLRTEKLQRLVGRRSRPSPPRARARPPRRSHTQQERQPQQDQAHRAHRGPAQAVRPDRVPIAGQPHGGARQEVQVGRVDRLVRLVAGARPARTSCSSLQSAGSVVSARRKRLLKQPIGWGPSRSATRSPARPPPPSARRAAGRRCFPRPLARRGWPRSRRRDRARAGGREVASSGGEGLRVVIGLVGGRAERRGRPPGQHHQRERGEEHDDRSRCTARRERDGVPTNGAAIRREAEARSRTGSVDHSGPAVVRSAAVRKWPGRRDVPAPRFAPSPQPDVERLGHAVGARAVLRAGAGSGCRTSGGGTSL